MYALTDGMVKYFNPSSPYLDLLGDWRAFEDRILQDIFGGHIKITLSRYGSSIRLEGYHIVYVYGSDDIQLTVYRPIFASLKQVLVIEIFGYSVVEHDVDCKRVIDALLYAKESI